MTAVEAAASRAPREWISGLQTADRPRVIIIGAGFAGLWAARALRRSRVEVLLLDRNNYPVFLPLLYQVGAAELESEEIAAPVRSILCKFPNVHFGLGEITEIDLDAPEVCCDGLRVTYDYLIIATGSVTHYFSIPGAREASFPLKNLAEGVALRSHILRCFEAAVNESDREVRRRKLRFVIVGGGATGVEFAGALAELVRGPLARDFPRLDRADVSLHLIEAQEHLLGMLSPRLGA